MIPVSYSVPGELTSPKFAAAFARGCGGAVVRNMQLQDGPVAGFFTPKLWPVLRQARAEGREWYYADHGFFGRGKYYRIAKNAFQHDGTGDADPRRFQRFNRPVQPWQKDGKHILICPQSATYFGLFGLNLWAWVDGVCRKLRAVTDRPIIVRMAKNSPKPIQANLVDCWAVVTFSSSAALDALIAGVPVFVLADFAAAHRMGLSDLSQIESPFYPDDRLRFLSVLAEHQWTLDEIRWGAAWKALSRES